MFTINKFTLLKVKTEEYKQEVKEMGVDVAIDRAYELTVKQEIIDGLLYAIIIYQKKK